MTREHVISASALRVVFGEEVRNVVSGDVLKGKHLFDHEPVVRNVCSRCNGRLSTLGIDDAGRQLVSDVMPFHDPTDQTIGFTDRTIRWLLKTHLNYLSIIKSSETGDTYSFPFALKKALIHDRPLRYDRFALFVQSWQGKPYSWSPPSPQLLNFFGYRNVEFRSQRTVVCDLRIKNVCFILLLPSDGEFQGFEERVRSTIEECRRDVGLEVTRIRASLVTGRIRPVPVIPWETVQEYISPNSIVPLAPDFSTNE